MTRTFYILFFFLFLMSCEQNERNFECQTSLHETDNCSFQISTPPPILPEGQTTTSLVTDVPAQALSWNADVYTTNFSRVQEEKVKMAVELIKKVIASAEFKERVLNYTYNGHKKFFDNHDMTNEEIYQKILDGAEMMGNTNKNNTMDVELELYYQATTTIGYTYPNTSRIWMNTKYFNKYTPNKVADNLMHEWMHKLGFTHAITWSKERDHSVPYAIGYLLEDIAARLPK
jgi:hypothetical protein